MPQKTGPAIAKKGTQSAAKGSDADQADSAAPEPSETPENAAVDQAAVEPAVTEIAVTEAGGDAEVEVQEDKRTPEERAKAALIALYPEDTELWFGVVQNLWFAFPRITTIQPKRQWLRQIYLLTETAQTFEWMMLANVPMQLQSRTDALTDEEYQALFNAWFMDGEVSLPK